MGSLNPPSILPLIVVCCLLVLFPGSKSDPNPNPTITIVTDGTYSIGVDNTTWLQSGETFFVVNGKFYRTGDKSLLLLETSATSGTDQLGNWQKVIFLYQAGDVNITCYIKTYLQLPAVFFGQVYTQGASGTSVGDPNATAGGFPSFKVKSMPSVTLGYMSYGGFFFGDTTKQFGLWDDKTFNINDGLEGGPVVVFRQPDKSSATGAALVISTSTQFMATSAWFDARTLFYGPMGSMNEIPQGFLAETVLVYGEGINKAMDAWGMILRNYYGKPDLRGNDATLNYIGYWTDNGAYYYYHTEPGQNYEQTITTLWQNATKDVPFRYLQLDSWWYTKDTKLGGVVEWRARKDVFPDGIKPLHDMAGPIAAHNRFWSPETVYAIQNGGNYSFAINNGKALPLEQRFWDDLFTEAAQWGLQLYEQDWLNVQVQDFTPLLTNITLGRDWLMQMSHAAFARNMSIQYCMSWPRHDLQSLEAWAVTQARVSIDYATDFQIGNEQWRIGISSIFSDALGIAASKDVFWSTSVQPDNPYNNATEPYPMLQALVSTLSTGPVGPGDRMGLMNASLLARSCRLDGMLLKPNRPARSIDAQIYSNAFGPAYGPNGELWTTYSVVGDYVFGIILAIDVDKFDLTPSLAGFDDQSQSLQVWSGNRWQGASAFSESAPLHLQSCTKAQFCLYYTAPVIHLNDLDVVFVGESNKWVPMAAARFSNLTVSSDDAQLELEGSAGELVMISLLVNGDLKFVPCILDSTGSAVLSVKGLHCGPRKGR